MGGATRVTARGRSFRGQFASCCSDALRQSPGSAAGSPCCVWRRPCSRQAMAYSAPLPAGTVVAARSLSGADGRCDSTSRSAMAAAARLQRGGVGPRGDGAVARARRSSRRVGPAVRCDAARGRRGAGGSAAAWPWTGAGGGKGAPGVQARRRPPRRGRRAKARKRPCLICARRVAFGDLAPACRGVRAGAHARDSVAYCLSACALRPGGLGPVSLASVRG